MAMNPTTFAFVGPSSARRHRRHPEEAQATERRSEVRPRLKPDEDDGYEGDTVVQPFVAIGARHGDFSARSWWMVDLDANDSTQGATALVKRCMRSYGWDLSLARQVLLAYKQFIALKKTRGDWDAALLSPCCLVNQMWQQHVLDNFNYYHDMLLLCDRFVAYDPDGILDVAAATRRNEATRGYLREHFGSYDTKVWDRVGENEGLSINKDPNGVQENNAARCRQTAKNLPGHPLSGEKRKAEHRTERGNDVRTRNKKRVSLSKLLT
jgi:hypothetical protein